MGNYDGSIRIDTRVDTKGINTGTKNINGALSGLFASLKRLGGALAVAFSAAAVFRFVKNVVSQFDFMNSSVGGSIAQLKSSFEGFKGALAGVVAQALAALTPVIIVIIGWLTKLLQILSAVISVLFGVKVGMAGVATGSNSAAGGQKKLAKETTKAGKAAKGALAPFDELNVLQMEEKPSQPDASTGGGGDGGLSIPELEVLPGIAKKVEAFKNKMLEFFAPVIEAAGRLYEALKPLGKTLWEGLQWAWENILVPFGEWTVTDLIPGFLDLLASAAKALNEVLIAFAPSAESFFEDFLIPLGEFAGDAIIKFLGFLSEKLDELAVWIKDNPEKFRSFMSTLGIFVVSVMAFLSVLVIFFSGFASLTALAFASIIAFIVLVIANWGKLKTTVEQITFIISYYVKNMVEGIKNWFLDMVNNTLLRFQELAALLKAMRENFVSQLVEIRIAFTNTFSAIYNFIKGIVNNIISLISSMVSNVVSSINSIISAANAVASIIPGASFIPKISAPKIPKLATGAVIPPNAEFAAILGDQKSGRNIESPESLLRQIVREESQAGNSGGEIIIKFEGTLASLVRELKPYIDKENVRIGSNLIKTGGITK